MGLRGRGRQVGGIKFLVLAELTSIPELYLRLKEALPLISASALIAFLPSHISSTGASVFQSHSHQLSRHLLLATMSPLALLLARINGPSLMVCIQSLPMRMDNKYAKYS